MEQRAKLLIWQPLTKQEHLKTVPLPDRMEDEYGAPPVVVWLEPLPPEKRRPAASRVSHHRMVVWFYPARGKIQTRKQLP